MYIKMAWRGKIYLKNITYSKQLCTLISLGVTEDGAEGLSAQGLGKSPLK